MAIIGIICVVCAATMMGGCIGGTSESEYGAQVPVQGAGNVVIVEHDLVIEKYNGWRSVEGVVKNTGKAPITWAEIEVTFYDANRNVLGDNSRQISELYQGDTHDFSIVYMGTYPKNVVGYAVAIIRYLPLY